MNTNFLKILFISKDKFPPYRVDVSILFGKEIVKKGHKIDWVFQSDADCRRSYKCVWNGGVAWVGRTKSGSAIMHRTLKHFFGFLHNVTHVVLLFRCTYDLVQMKDRFFSSIIYLIAAKLTGTKFFFWLSYPFAEASLHHFKSGSARYPMIYLIRGIVYRFLLYKIIMSFSDHCFIQSEQMKKDIEKEGIDPNRMTVVPMGFDPEDFVNFKPNEYDFTSSHPPIIAYLGTLGMQRRLDFVIRMFANVLKSKPEAKLLMIGAGDSCNDIEFLRNQARSLNILESVIFTGFIERKKALELIMKADVCLSPFYPTQVLNSTSPTKLIEYMALGKPVVANDHPEQKLVLKSSRAGYCVPYNEKEFAKAVLNIIANPHIGQELGKRGKTWVYKNRSYNSIANLVEATYFRELSLCVEKNPADHNATA